MRIGFDAKRLFNNFTGLGNYSRFVVDALHREYPDDQLLLFTPKIKPNPDTFPFIHDASYVKVMPAAVFGKVTFGSFWRTFRLGAAAKEKAVDIFHGLSLELPVDLPRGMRSVVTVHDLIFLRYPEFYNPIDVAIYKAKVKRSCRIADRVIAISEQTAEDLRTYLNVPAAKITVVYQGTHPVFKKRLSIEAIQSVREKYGLPQRYILSVGTLEERKNTGLLVQALSCIDKATRIPVVLVGRKTVYVDQLNELARKGDVTSDILFIHNAAFADLPALYQGATVFVYPSLFEGFGIPLVEAIESRIPVITSTGSCFREAAGPGALYVDPKQPDVLARHLSEVLNDPALAARMVSDGLTYIQRFQPPVIARELRSVYESVLKNPA